MSTILSERISKARKNHYCEQCGRHVVPGEIYYAQAYVDGELATYKAHIECNQAADDYRDMADLSYDDDPVCLQNCIDCNEDRQWLLEKHPLAAARLGIKTKVAT